MLRMYCPTFFHLSWIFAGSNINQQNMSFNVLKFCAIKTADGALSALHLGKKIKTNEQKESTKGDVMQKILENK